MAEKTDAADPLDSPDVKLFVEILSKEPKWYDLGKLLNVPVVELDRIAHDHRDATIMRCYIEIYKCLKYKGLCMSWEHIANCLSTMGNHDLVRRIHQLRFRPDPAVDHPAVRLKRHVSSSAQNLSPSSFSKVLSKEPDWYTLGVFLGIPTRNLDDIALAQDLTPSRCYIKLFEICQSIGVNVSWELIAKCLKNMGNKDLAHKIYSLYVLPRSLEVHECSTLVISPQYVPHISTDLDCEHHEKFLEIMEFFKYIQCLMENYYSELSLLQPADENVQPIAYDWLQKAEYSFLQSHYLVYLSKYIREKDVVLQELVLILMEAVQHFKSSAVMDDLASMINATGTNEKLLKLVVQNFWSKFTVELFESIMDKILETNVIMHMSLIQVTMKDSFLFVTWVIPNHFDFSKFIRNDLSFEVMKIIGVMYLQIGNEVIYSFERKKCKTIESAMLQAMELENTQAIELLLAMGCSPKVATNNGDNAVTMIVNIRETSSASGSNVHHVCVLGHNEHVEAIVGKPQDTMIDPQLRVASKAEDLVEKQIDKELQNIRKLNEPMNVSDVGIQFDYTIPVAEYIDGAYIAGRESYVIQGSNAQTLDWNDYGLKMHFPQGTLQPNEEFCEVAVLALVGGNFKFPEGTELVSAIYAISFQKQVVQPVQVEMEHCVALETQWQTTQLHFVTTGKQQSENVFEFVEGGQFQIGSRYGYIERMHFCKKGIAKATQTPEKQDNDDLSAGGNNTAKGDSNLKYLSSLLYEKEKFNDWLLTFLVYKQIKVYHQFVKNKCDVRQPIPFVFIDSYIEFILSDSVPDGWIIHPHTLPLKLLKSDVDCFGLSEQFPSSCCVTIYGKQTPGGTEPLHHPVTMRGIKCAVEKIFIVRSLEQAESAVNSTGQNSKTSQNSIQPSSPSTNIDADTVKKLVSIVRDVFTSYLTTMTDVLKYVMEDFAREMLQAKLILSSRSPSYETIVDQFLSKLVFIKESELIEQQFLTFFQILNKLGLENASDTIKKDLVEEMQNKLSITLNL